jgi:MFS family permease
MSVPIETPVGETPSAKGSFGFRFMAPLCLGSMLNPVNSTMISTALVAIARDFQATVAETGLLIGGFYITSAIAQPTMLRRATVNSDGCGALGTYCGRTVSGYRDPTRTEFTITVYTFP